jgi:D-psicose/D-tagatose/L-ribulose 3-epimerase
MNLLLWTGSASREHVPLLEKIKLWGFDGVEFPMFAADGSRWSELAQACNDSGLGRTAVSVLPRDTNLIGDNAAERRGALEHLKRCVDACVELGADALCGPIYSPVGRLVGRGPTEQERAWCVEGLQHLGRHAQGCGVKISVEPLNRFETYFLNCQRDARALVDAVATDGIGILYDTFHANIEEKNVTEAIQFAGKRINHVHVSANDRATPGEDHIDYATTFETLKGIGYDGWLVIESFGMWIPDLAAATCIWRKMAPSEEHVAREGLKFIRSKW